MIDASNRDIKDFEFESAHDTCLSVMNALLRQADELEAQAKSASGTEKEQLLKQAKKTERRASLYFNEGRRAKDGSVTAFYRTQKYHVDFFKRIRRGTVNRPYRYEHPQPF